MRKPKALRALAKPQPRRKGEAALDGIERTPNAETKRALREVRARKNLETFETVSEWAKSVRGIRVRRTP